MAVTQRQIAQGLGVSRELVKDALNGYGNVAAETRTRILAEARRVGYNQHTNKDARTLLARRHGRRVKHNIIAVVMNADPLIRSVTYFAESLEGVEQITAERDIDLFFCRHSRESLPRLIMDSEVDGVVSLVSTPELDRQLACLEVPVVMVSRSTDLYSSLTPDNRAGVTLAVQHLVDLGHRSIAYIGFKPDFSISRERLRGYRAALEKNGISIDDRYIDASITAIAPSVAAAAIDRMLENDESFRDGGRPGFTAVVCYNDPHGMGVVAQLQKRGLNVPGDISVVGFDDVSESQGFSPSLTSIAFDRVAMGRRAVEIIGSYANNEAAPGELIHEVFPVELHVRDSTAPPRN